MDQKNPLTLRVWKSMKKEVFSYTIGKSVN